MGKVTVRIRQPLPGETVFGGRGVLIPFRPSNETSTKPPGSNSESVSSPPLPAHDDPAFETLHRKGVREHLHSRQKPQSSPSDESNETP
jgi:hypothetical protein